MENQPQPSAGGQLPEKSRVYTVSVISANNLNNGRGNGNGNLGGMENAVDASRYRSGVIGERESHLNLVSINSRASIFQKREFYKKIAIALVILILILLIAVITTTYFYIYWWKQYKSQDKICNSEECLRSAANFRLSMDFTVDPCEDFYEFTCGRWTEEHPNHGWYPKFSNFEVIDERISISTINFFESDLNENLPLPVRQSKDFYLSCLDTDSTNNLGYSVIYKYLKEVDLPEIPAFLTKPIDDLDDFKFDWITSMTKIQKIIGLDTFIQFTVEPDIYNRSENVIYLGSTVGQSPLPSPLNKFKQANKKTRNSKSTASEGDAMDYQQKYELAFKKTMKEIITVVIANKTTLPIDTLIDTAVEMLFNMTAEISEMSSINNTQEIEIITMSVEELQKMTDDILTANGQTPFAIWTTYLDFMFKDVENVTLNYKKDLIRMSPLEIPYLVTIIYYLGKTPDYLIEMYLWWSSVYSMIINTTGEISEFIYKTSRPFYKNTPTVRSRSLDCAELVINFMGIAVSYGIADKDFIMQTKPRVEQMLKDIKEAFVVRVNNLPWMDKATKKATLEKSEEMVSFIGFPEWLLNKTVIEEYYSNIIIHNDTYLENMISLIQSYTPSVLSSLRIENERTWRTDPTTVNAYNYFGDNSINVPMAILSYPIYHLGLEVLNYGSIGTILGHELTHGFDNTGRRFDKYGNFKEWWTNNTIETFETKTECFVNQYENYTLPEVDITVNGKLTLGENLADNGGINHAFTAYRKYVKKYGKEPKLPGFESYSDNQLFFIAFGSIWCETRDTQELIDQLQTDEHCPSALRVLGTLQNSQDFATAFKCPAGSKMNPKRNKCRIW